MLSNAIKLALLAVLLVVLWIVLPPPVKVALLYAADEARGFLCRSLCGPSG